MRPVLLEMTAFGSYARETSIDFRRFDHNLYLITGDTGAGKTTIFDGIMMALYGEASGEGDKKFRTFEMMHCDYADRSEDTVVKLTFAHMGKTHTVERTLHFQKSRDTGEYEKAQQKAVFWEEGKDPIKNPRAVTGRIEELLGMDARQFRKIVMLAQGEFKKFLDADSDEKNAILGDLFDNSAYVYYQELFDKARDKLENRRRQEGTGRIAKAMEEFLWPLDMSQEEREAYTAGHSGLEEALEGLIRKDAETRQQLEDRIKTLQSRENTLREQLGSAREQNKKLEELARKEKELEELWEKKQEMERLKEETDRADRAFYRVRPKEQLFLHAKKVYEDALAKTRGLQESFQQLKEERQAKEEAFDRRRREDEPVIRDLEIRIANMEQAIPLYGDLQQKLTQQQEESKKAEEAEIMGQKAREEKDRAEQVLGVLDGNIKALEGIEAETVGLKAALDQACRDLDRLTGPNGVKDRMEQIHYQQEQLLEEQEKLRVLVKEAGELEHAYHRLYQAFIEGQAGLLAKGLEQELKEKEEAVCPVCQRVLYRHQRQALARVKQEIPKQKDVDRAKEAFEKKDKDREDRANRSAVAETTLKGMRASALECLREMGQECPDWETVSGGFLDKVICDYETRKLEAKKNYDRAACKSRDLAGFKEERAKRLEELQACEEAVRKNRESWQEHTVKSSALKAAVRELRKTLPYPDRKTAESRKMEWEAKRDALAQTMEEARQAFQEAERRCQVTAGALEGSLEKLPGYEEEMDKKKGLLFQEARERGFESLEEVHRALSPPGAEKQDMGQWIGTRKEELGRYKNNLENTRNRVRDLKEGTKDLSKADITQMEDDIKRLEQERETVQRELDRSRSVHDNHKKTWEHVREANAMLKTTEAAWRRLEDLADLAAGTRNAAGGRLSFDRYVMGYLFREVLEMANRRLDIMSGGRYELIHERNVKRDNAKAGLEISVLDMTTGKRRPASSLSGGESFFASLSLALGLSDVVQNHAGGRQLDALFIDEGFGSLDGDVLDRALWVLNGLTKGKRLVGIISHVSRLEESIPQQLRVRNSGKGSWIENHASWREDEY